MTIIAGFPVTGFVVLGADGEEGNAIHKGSVRKIEMIVGEEYRCFVGGAGGGNFIDRAVQDAREAIAELNPATLEDIRETLEYIVTDIHCERIDKLPDREAFDARFELLCAIWAAKDNRAQLIKVGRGYSLVRGRADVIGIGDYLASYLIASLQLGESTRRHAERLCAYVLAKCKAHVQGCGGPSQIVVLDDAGKMHEVPSFVITEDEIAADIVMDGVRFMFNWTDLIGWTGDLGKIDTVIDDVARVIKRGFQTRMNQLKANLKAQLDEQVPQPPKDDPPVLPPSPESPGE